MEEKSIVATWLFKTTLSNLNAGEGSTNLTEIKTYRNGLPYISGQSVRHALREAIRREHPSEFKCTVEFPCGDIQQCWLCDMFGYLIPKRTKRWSPIKASPALGQIRTPITTDMILRLVNDIECPHCHKKINPFQARGEEGGSRIKEIKQGTKLKCPECGKDFEAPYDIRQAIAYKQLIENIYRVSISIDIAALGVEEVPIIKDGKMNGISRKDMYGKKSETERKTRIKAILNGIANMSDFASQSRELTNASPDIILLSVQKEYNHRLSSALEMDEKGNIDPERFRAILEDCLSIHGTKIYAGVTPGIIKNEDKIFPILKDSELKKKGLLCLNEESNGLYTPQEAIQKVIGIFGGN